MNDDRIERQIRNVKNENRRRKRVAPNRQKFSIRAKFKICRAKTFLDAAVALFLDDLNVDRPLRHDPKFSFRFAGKEFFGNLQVDVFDWNVNFFVNGGLRVVNRFGNADEFGD